MPPLKKILITLVGLLAAGGSAQAGEPVEVQLIYRQSSEAERCPTREGIIDAVSARLGYHPFKDQAQRSILVDIQRKGTSLRARVEMRGEGDRLLGKRDLSSSQDDCRELAAAVELAICIAIDPLSLNQPQSATPASRPAPRTSTHLPEPPPVVKAPTPVAPQSPTARRIGISASLGGLLALGSAPEAAGGFNLQARLKWAYLSLGLEGRVDLPAYSEVPGGQISSSLITGALVPCAHLGPLCGCALIVGGAMRAAGHELLQARSDTLPFFAGGLRLGAELKLSARWSLRASADLLAAFSRITLKESETGRILWTSSVVSGAFGLAAVIHIL